MTLIAFSLEKQNKVIREKLWKGTGMLVLLVGLVLARNVMGRREKIRQFDTKKRVTEAKDAILATLPKGSVASGDAHRDWRARSSRGGRRRPRVGRARHGQVPEHVVGPLVHTSGELPHGARLVLVAAGIAEDGTTIDVARVAEVVARWKAAEREATADIAADAAAWARGKSARLVDSDIAVIVVERSP